MNPCNISNGGFHASDRCDVWFRQAHKCTKQNDQKRVGAPVLLIIFSTISLMWPIHISTLSCHCCAVSTWSDMVLYVLKIFFNSSPISSPAGSVTIIAGTHSSIKKLYHISYASDFFFTVYTLTSFLSRSQTTSAMV